MVKRMAITILLDLLVVGCLASVIIPRSEQTRECSEDLYRAGLAICAYNAFFVVRNLIICASCYLSKNPVTYSTISRGACVCLDCILYTYCVAWVTYQISREKPMECKSLNDEVGQFWWVVMILTVVGYLQLFVEWIICLAASCVLCVFCCFYFAQNRARRAEALARFRQRAPLMARALDSMKRQKFKDIQKEVKDVESCIICFAQFKPNDDVVQLSCNARHIYHKACLEQWVKSSHSDNTLQCPICRTNMVEEQ